MRIAFQRALFLALLSCWLRWPLANHDGSNCTCAIPVSAAVLTDARRQTFTGVVGVTLSLYKEQQGGAPFWVEVQNVKADRTGRFTVTLGATADEGLPSNLFVSGEARWFGVRVEGQEEQPRVMLLSVPYALKAGDAQTIGGLPPSAFMLAAPMVNGHSTRQRPLHRPGSLAAVAAPGIVERDHHRRHGERYSPVHDRHQHPELDSYADRRNRDQCRRQTKPSRARRQPLRRAASSRGLRPSSPRLSTALRRLRLPRRSNCKWSRRATIRLHHSATLNLLYGSGTRLLAETGLKINNKGLITFAAGQTFPGGGGKGTITGVTAGTGSDRRRYNRSRDSEPGRNQGSGTGIEQHVFRVPSSLRGQCRLRSSA